MVHLPLLFYRKETKAQRGEGSATQTSAFPSSSLAVALSDSDSSSSGVALWAGSLPPVVAAFASLPF